MAIRIEFDSNKCKVALRILKLLNIYTYDKNLEKLIFFIIINFKGYDMIYNHIMRLSFKFEVNSS